MPFILLIKGYLSDKARITVAPLLKDTLERTPL